jgi:hypothetical protein
MSDVPNPYGLYPAPPPHSLIEPPALPLPEIARERRYFEMEDSGDRMGIQLSKNVLVGLQVEWVGPAEEPRSYRRIIVIKHDPFHPIYLLTTVGVRIRF